MLGGMLCLNLIMGFVIHKVTDLDWITSFMCAVPGGIGLFPSLILTVTKNEKISQQEMQVRKMSDGSKSRQHLCLPQWWQLFVASLENSLAYR